MFSPDLSQPAAFVMWLSAFSSILLLASERWQKERRMGKRRLWKGLLAGGAAGLAASFAMNEFQTVWTKASKKIKGGETQNSSSDNQSSGESEDATMRAAGKIAEITGHKLTHEQKKKAGPIVHYAFGTGMGALYGVLMEVGPRRVRRHELLSSVGFGSVLFAGADEIAVPAAGLSGPPSDSPLSSHLYALASHIVYGLTTGAVRKAVRAAL
jgi:putative membrane protein